ncbi:MAG: tryptophan 2,3-dioxygenase family protein [Candidatus Eremiobacteraeota bacterium]|nr:tryptophan 2,3-dioxygenase family protein [Candidatus Eremiobacteraeota bacterium]
MSERVSYGSYLKVPQLLELQTPLSTPAHHDELLFIIIHQVYELWFKQIMHELEAVMRHLASSDLLKAAKHFRRIHTIQRLLEQQVDILETMTPQEFNEFRDHLNPASGFQSMQFREIEFLGGLKKTEALKHLEMDDAQRAKLERRLNEPTLHDAMFTLLAQRGFAVATHDERINSLKTIYEHASEHYDLYMLMEDLVEFDERFLLWRGRHVRMVERMIGSKMGTGGSPGVAYLATTLDKKFFPELWEVRTHLGGDTYGG